MKNDVWMSVIRMKVYDLTGARGSMPYATNWKVAGSILNEVMGFFN
jgi:hypothetical protein